MSSITPSNRKVLVAITEAHLDSMPSLEVSKIHNQPGVEFFVIDGESRFDPAITDQILDQYAIEPGMILIQNPFDTSNYLIESEAVVEIALAKTSHVAHICHVLGSTSVKVAHVTSAIDQHDKHLAGEAGFKGATAKLSGKSSAVDELKQRISLSDTSSGGEPDVELARSYLASKRLSKDTVLTGLIDQRSVTNNRITGRDLTIDATREARSSLEIASKLSIADVIDAGVRGSRSDRRFDQINVTYEIRF